MSGSAGCHAIRQSDEMHCARCGLRWDVTDMTPDGCGEDWMSREARLSQYGNLDAGTPNHEDHSRRGFAPR